MIEQDIASYLAHLKYVQGGAKNTVVAYGTDLRQFRRVLGHHSDGALDTETLSPEAFSPYLDWLEEQAYKPSTIARKLASLRSFLAYMEQERGMHVSEHLKRLSSPPSRPNAPRALSRRQINRLIHEPSGSTNARDIRDAAILSFLYATGVRTAEAVAVTVHDIDLTRSMLDRPYAETDPLPLHVAHQPLERYIKEGRPQLLRKAGESALFLNQRGRRLTRQGIWLVVKRWASACDLGQDVSPYTLRHSLTRHLLQSGHTRREVQATLGLSSPNSIRKYLSSRVR
ncbi:MAG: tyrosine-type recombinase/integrase [Anaerolineales bacterium]